MSTPSSVVTPVPVATPVVVTPVVTTPVVVQSKPFNRTAYIIIAVVFIVLIIIYVVIMVVMFFSNSGLFSTNYTRPPPADSNLIPVNGNLKTLTPAEQATL